jgi:hypothetical protein
MAMPTKDKTWTFDVNNVVWNNSSASDIREIIFALKGQLVAAGWTVRWSCNHDAVAAEWSDNWTDTGDLIWDTSANPRSWIVLRAPDYALGPEHFELLIECRYYSASYPTAMRIACTPAGDYHDGTTSVAPVSDVLEVNLLAAASSAAANFVEDDSYRKVWHCMYSSDSECFRFFVTSRNYVCTLLVLDKIKNPVSGLNAADTWIGLCQGSAGSLSTKPTIAALNGAAAMRGSGNSGVAGIYYYITGESAGGALWAASALNYNPNDGNAWPLGPMGLVTTSNVAYAYGRNGEVFDMWWAPSYGLTALTYPNDGSLTFIQVGNLLMPWDGASLPVFY